MDGDRRGGAASVRAVRARAAAVRVLGVRIEDPPGNIGDVVATGDARLRRARRHTGCLLRAPIHRATALVARHHHGTSLDIVGDNRSYPFEDVAAAIDREDLGGRIRWHRFATDEQLADLYSSARAFAFLSEYEGLGLTPLEALAAGVPSVLLDTPVARESCAGAALYVPKDSVAITAAALEQLLFDETVRDGLLNEAPAVLARY